MRIIIATTMIPFRNTDIEIVINDLANKLGENGCETQIIRIPFSMDEEKQMKQMLGMRMYNLEKKCDRLIAINLHAGLLKHTNKYIWFSNFNSSFYELWNNNDEDNKDLKKMTAIREYIKRADELAMREAKKVFAMSAGSAEGLEKNGFMDIETLHPALHTEKKYYEGIWNNYIYYHADITDANRQMLAIDAMQCTKTPVKLLLASNNSDDSTKKRIKRYITEKNLEEKVIVLDKGLTQEERIQKISECLAVLYIPIIETEYSMFIQEALYCHKPVITCNDSLYNNEFIQDNVNGIYLDPVPSEIAEVIDQLYEDKQRAERLGENGYRQLKEKNYTWDNVIRRFIE